MRSRFHILVAEKERKDGRRYSDSLIAAETKLSRPTISLYRTPNQHIDRMDARVITAICHWAGCGVGDLLELVNPGAS